MDERVRVRGISRLFSDNTLRDTEDEMLAERRVSLIVDGRREALVVLTPGEEELWALGSLCCRRMIESADDIASVEVQPDKVIVERSRKLDGWPLETRYLHTASGAFLAENRGARDIFLPVEWKMSFASIMSGIEWTADAPLFQRTGSVHVAALISPAGEKLFRTEDVGRHNAVDKAVGWLLKNNLRPKGAALITSGRLPEDMVMKGLGAGIPLMASVSAATIQGAEAARRGNMTLIGFARGRRMNVYSAPERLDFQREADAAKMNQMP